MEKLTAEKYRELFKLRAEGKLEDMECTKRLFKILKPLYFEGIKTLDIPCGVGHYFRKIRELGDIEYLGLDLDSKAIEMAREVWKDVPNARFDVQGITNIGLENNSMDIVFCYNLLLHLKDYQEALRELFRVSKKYIIIRSLFGGKEDIKTVKAADDYLEVYPSGEVYYNTYAKEEVTKFLKNLGPCEFKFIKDNSPIPNENIDKQRRVLKVDSSEFAKGGGDKKQELGGLRLNYEVLLIKNMTLDKKQGKIKYCKKCVMPSTRPRIEFDEEEVCNACRYAERKKDQIDWSAREQKFREILDRYRSKKPGKYDCVIPTSGGKDSTYIAYMMKNKYKMNCLAVTFAPNMYTDAGLKNVENFKKIGIDHIQFTPDKSVLRKLSKKMFIEYGDPFVPWVAGVFSTPLRVAVNFGIPLVVYAECGEAEYGGSTEKDDSFEILESDLQKFVRPGDAENWKYPENWTDEEISLSDLKPYIFLTQEELSKADVNPIYYGYFHYWSDYEHYKFVKEKIGFNEVKNRIEGSYTSYSSIDDKMDNLYMHLMILKYGFGRATKDSCKDIRAGRLTREEAIELVKKYDTEFPSQYLSEDLEFLDMEEEELRKVLESFRNKDLWEKSNGGWKLKYPIWKENKF